MALKREVKRARSFIRSMKHLSRKHPGIGEIVCAALSHYSENGVTEQCRQLQGHTDPPVFKVRLPLPNVGKRGGVRLIFSCTQEEIIALAVYLKSDQSDYPVKEIAKALLSAREADSR